MFSRTKKVAQKHVQKFIASDEFRDLVKAQVAEHIKEVLKESTLHGEELWDPKNRNISPSCGVRATDKQSTRIDV